MDLARSTEVNVCERSGTILVTVRGEIDLATAPQFQRGLCEAERLGAAPVIVDLCDVTFMDSAGLGTLLLEARRIQRCGRPVVLACVPDGSPARLFELALPQIFRIFSCADEAIAAVQPSRAA